MLKPDYLIKINGYKVNLKNILTDISLIDKSGDEADELSFTILDINNFALPEEKGKLEAWLGYKNNLKYLGEFTIDQVGFSGAPDVISVTASGGTFASSINEPKSIAYNSMTLDKIIEFNANFAQLPFAIHPDFKKIQIPYRVQSQKTPLVFLKELAAEQGAIFSVKNGKIIFTKKGFRPDGKKIQPLIIKKSITSSYDFKIKAREKRITGVKARWQNMQTGESGVALAGKEGYCHTLPLEYPPARAQELADAKFAELSAIVAEASLELVKGDFNFFAGAEVSLKGFKKSFNRKFIIKEANHSFSSSDGYKTSLQLETI